MTPSREVRLALARRYETLAELRRARDRGEPRPERSFWVRLAHEHPGSLRELDTLPLPILDARAAALRAAAEGGALEAWMILLAHHRALWIAALWIKRAIRPGDSIDDARAEALAREASAHAGVDVDNVGDESAARLVDAAFARGVARPPRGRLEILILAHLEREHGRPAAEIAALVLPDARG